MKLPFTKALYYFQVASSLLPTEVKPGVAVATITGELSGKDNKYLLQPLQAELSSSRKRENPSALSHPHAYHWGSLDVNEFVQQLNKVRFYQFC